MKSILSLSLALLLLATIAAGAEGDIVYYSSNKKLDQIHPNVYTREGKHGEVTYESEVVLGHLDYRIAIYETFNNDRGGVEISIDLVTPTPDSEPITFHFRGGQSLEDALDKVYGSSAVPESQYGYIYSLNAKNFTHEPGLATKEIVSHDSFNHPSGKRINRREELKRLVDAGQVKLDWKPARHP